MTQDSEGGSNPLERSDWEAFPSDSEHQSEQKPKPMEWNIDLIVEMLRDGRLEPDGIYASRNSEDARLSDLEVHLKGTFLAGKNPLNEILRISKIGKDGTVTLVEPKVP